MVFQNYALYPHMSVYDSMAYGLKMRRMGRAEIRERVERAAGILQLQDLLGRKPRQLSGGQAAAGGDGTRDRPRPQNLGIPRHIAGARHATT
jgi:ABC-type proline/glycine betaine transport system ATPase subunit